MALMSANQHVALINQRRCADQSEQIHCPIRMSDYLTLTKPYPLGSRYNSCSNYKWWPASMNP